MEITILLDNVKDVVKRQLSIIGKHHSTQKGDTLFAVSTLSSLEETVMQQYIEDGAQLVASNLSPVLQGYTFGKKAGLEKVSYLSFDVNTTRSNDALSEAAQDSVKTLLIAYVTQSVLAMVLPELAGKYATDVQTQLLATTRLVFTKTPPSSSEKTLADCEGSVTL
ncbi:hypothetical protein [uncultured Prevotella sp.]|jgi:hypothetical protein|uniref:hypothetical protein n=1 Tax=uncultured Prevotella sp. TaxID=159272 RepID=UPI0025EE88D1|nr:hypothetical protein [uncultured Prevotella sp.]